MILYDKPAEMIAWIRDPSYNPKTDKKGKIIEHCLDSQIDFEYKDNPHNPKSGQMTKRTNWPVRKCYNAKSTSEQQARDFFRQELVRTCGGSPIEIDASKAKIIKAAW